MGDLPDKRMEKGQIWERAKAYVLQQLEERGDIPSPDMVRELNEKFDFKYEAAPYGIIKALIKLKQIHYSMLGTGKGARLLQLGPPRGGITITEEVPKVPFEDTAPVAQSKPMGTIKPRPKPKHKPKPTPVAIQEAVEEKPQEEEITVSEAAPLPTVEHKVAEASSEPSPEPVAPTAPEPEPTPPTVVEKQSPEQEPTPVVTYPLTDEEREAKAMMAVTAKTAKNILAQVDKELEKALSPEIKAQLRLVYAMAQESGMTLQRSPSALVQRDTLKRLFG